MTAECVGANPEGKIFGVGVRFVVVEVDDTILLQKQPEELSKERFLYIWEAVEVQLLLFFVP